MSIQKIIDRSETVTIARNKLAGSTISRSGRLRTNAIATAQPFKFTVKYAPMQQYTVAREIIEQLNRLDTVFTETIDIGATQTGLSWITEYQGDLSSANLDLLTISDFAGTILFVDTSALTGTSPTDFLFKKGDYIQFADGYKYPYTVTEDVTVGVVGTGSLTIIPLSRGIIEQNGYTIVGANIVAGTDVRWQVKMLSKPNFTLEPARYIEFDSDFELMEVIED
jgi:hypothetical protein